MTSEDDVDWEGWDDFVEVDLDENREEDWSFEDEGNLIAELVRESIDADIIICLTCGEICVQCVCD